MLNIFLIQGFSDFWYIFRNRCSLIGYFYSINIQQFLSWQHSRTLRRIHLSFQNLRKKPNDLVNNYRDVPILPWRKCHNQKSVFFVFVKWFFMFRNKLIVMRKFHNLFLHKKILLCKISNYPLVEYNFQHLWLCSSSSIKLCIQF